MSVSEDLINFDLIETHKENIQQLPGGRSARQLATILSPPPTEKSTAPTLDDTKTLNNAIRHEYELEVQNIADSDDPLDVYDRYVKWTLNAYPSAQATPQSQLLPLLERATKAFLSSSHYKNDPRYLKLWLHYIRWFSDAPREVFAYLARHNIGEGLALFYEEFARWLEGAGRWVQAEEVYNLGIQREARPTERLIRKFGQFQQRLEARPQGMDESTSPALPTVRPALAAKIDPFASTPTTGDRPTSGHASGGNSTGARSTKPKMAIFSDAGEPAAPATTAPSDGWQSIGSLQERKKENTIVAKPWAGETLKGGKRIGTAEKMTIFKDQTRRLSETKKSEKPSPSPQPIVNSKTGRPERVFVKLEAVYPNPADPLEEMSFDELRAAHRGWANKDWHSERKGTLQAISGNAQPLCSKVTDVSVEKFSGDFEDKVTLDDNDNSQQSTLTDSRESQGDRVRLVKAKKMKIREIKQETQTIKTNLASPTGPKIRRKMTAEPTMTFHSKAATNDVYDLFNQPLKCEVREHHSQSGGESDLEDDGYSTAGESTGTGMLSGAASECGREDTGVSLHTTVIGDENTSVNIGATGGANEWTEASVGPSLTTEENENTGTDLDGADVGEWTEFSSHKHVPEHRSYASELSEDTDVSLLARGTSSLEMQVEQGEGEELKTPVESEPRLTGQETTTSFIPLSAENYDPTSLRGYRAPTNMAHSRLPFMTPIVEKTESSLAANTAYQRHERDYFNSVTPSQIGSQISPIVGESPSKIGIETLVLRSEFGSGSPSGKEKKLLSSKNQNAKSPSPKSKRLPPASILDEEPDEFNSPRKRVQISKMQESPTRIKVRTHTGEEHSFVRQPPTPKRSQVQRKRPIITDLQCNPTDPSIREQILASTQPAPSSHPGFSDHSDQNSARCTQLQRYAKKVQESKIKSSPRKSTTNGNERTMTQAVPPVLSFQGASRVYAIKRELGRGAFAPVYLVDSYDPDRSLDSGDGDSLVVEKQQGRGSREAIKVESPPLQAAWEFHIIRIVHRRLIESRSSSSSSTQQTLASIITAHECHSFADEAFLVLDYCPFGTLLDLINTVKDSNQRAGKPEGGLDEILAMFFGVEVLRTMEHLHRIGILHGDLKADNCLLRLPPSSSSSSSNNNNNSNSNSNSNSSSNNSQILSKLLGPYCPSGANGWSQLGIKLIDFGRGIDLTSFPSRVGFIADWATAAATTTTGDTEAPEIREARPWKEQIDVWAAAGVLHSLLWGRYLEVLNVPMPVAGQGGEDRFLDGGIGIGGGGIGSLSCRNRKRYKVKAALKRYWAVDVWSRVFEVLLNPAQSVAVAAAARVNTHLDAHAGADDADATADVDVDVDADADVASVPPSVLNALAQIRGLMEDHLVRGDGAKAGLKAAVVRVAGLVG